MTMETLVTIVAFAALMVIFGVAMHAALRK